MSAAAPSPARPRRRWYQYGLRTLLLVTLAVCLICGWLGYLMKVYQGRAGTLQRIAELGGSYEAVPKGPAWLRRIIGEDYVEVTKVTLSPLQSPTTWPSFSIAPLPPASTYVKTTRVVLTEDDCKQLARLIELSELTISACEIESAGLPHLRRLTNLKTLALEGIRVTDANTRLELRHFPLLERLHVSRPAYTISHFQEVWDDSQSLEVHLEDLPSLTEAQFPGFRIQVGMLRGMDRLARLRASLAELSDEARDDLARLPSLEQADARQSLVTEVPFSGSPRLKLLDLRATLLGNDGLMPLAGLSQLEHLSLANTPIDDNGLSHLASLTNLRTLDLSGTKVTGSGFSHLVGAERLSHVMLKGTPVADQPLTDLRRLRGLVYLDLDETGVTDAGLKHLFDHSALQWVSLYRTKVTHDSAMRVMRQQPPGLGASILPFWDELLKLPR